MFDYGRYTPYVLTSYGIAVAVIIGLIVWSVVRVTNAKKKLEAIEPTDTFGKKDAAP
jgi:heme exporter protein CcmD